MLQVQRWKAVSLIPIYVDELFFFFQLNDWAKSC